MIMGVTIYWADDAETIVRYDLVGRWTWDELYPEYNKAIQMEESKPHRVDVILDMRNNSTIPPNALTHIKNITDKQPENIGVSVLVTQSRFVQILYDTAVKFYGKIGDYFSIVSSIEDAYAIIAESRERDGNDPLASSQIPPTTDN